MGGVAERGERGRAVIGKHLELDDSGFLDAWDFFEFPKDFVTWGAIEIEDCHGELSDSVAAEGHVANVHVVLP